MIYITSLDRDEQFCLNLTKIKNKEGDKSSKPLRATFLSDFKHHTIYTTNVRILTYSFPIAYSLQQFSLVSLIDTWNYGKRFITRYRPAKHRRVTLLAYRRPNKTPINRFICNYKKEDFSHFYPKIFLLELQTFSRKYNSPWTKTPYRWKSIKIH